MNILRVFFIVVFFIFSRPGISQNSNFPTVVPPSPNVASIMKFSDIPISPYTGTSDVTVPVYVIQAKGLNVPVSLNYHTGGIRIKEESGWVGLGWSLSAGGVISRTILDKDDFDGGKYFTADIPQLPGDINGPQPTQTLQNPSTGYFFDFFCNSKVNTSNGQMDFFNAFAYATAASNYDMEPDVYSYSFPGNSGKFIITRDRKVILQKQANIKISFENNGNSFTILDEQGNKFYFADKEYTQPATGILSPSISSWNLSQIVSQENAIINFNYYSDNTWTYVAPEYYDTYSAFCTYNGSIFHGNGAGTNYLNETLQSIDFPNGQLQFSFDNQRQDLQGAKKLNSIKLYSKLVSGLNYLKEFDLFYSYFNNTATVDILENKRLRLDSVRETSGTSFLTPYIFTYNDPQGPASFAKHGYSIDHWGFFNGISNNTSYIPSTTVYYNPPGANIGGNSPSTVLTYSGANREPDNSVSTTFMKAFSLQQVKYPTGGKTVFEYEANDFDNRNSVNGPQDFPQVTLVHNQTTWDVSARGQTTGTLDLTGIYPSLSVGSNVQNATLTITFLSSSNDCNVHYTNTFGKIYFRFQGTGYSIYEDISTPGLTCTTNSPANSVNIPLSITAGGSYIYNWTGYIDPVVLSDFNKIHLLLTWDQVQTISINNPNYSPTLTAGGLRIKSITDYSNDILIAKKRTYSYNYTLPQSGNLKYSYGRLMSYPSYARYVSGPSLAGGQCNSLRLEGSSNTPLVSAIQGNIVGYDQVTEFTVDPVTNNDIGKTVYSFFNSSDTVMTYGGFRFPGTFNIGNSMNGSLLSKTILANTGGGNYRNVSATINTYHTGNRIIYFSPKYELTGQTTNTSVCSSGSVVQSEALACFYPSIKSERLLQDNTVENVYDLNDPTKLVSTTKTYFYDNPLHYQLTRSSSVNSKGDKTLTAIRYPQDYIPTAATLTGNTILDNMITRNMVNMPIEKIDTIFYGGNNPGSVTGAQLTNYRGLPGTSVLLDKQLKLDITKPVTDFQPFSVNNNVTAQDSRYRNILTMNLYDTKNSLVQYTATDLVPVSFVWDYSAELPIAKIQNADSNSVAYTSFESDGTGRWLGVNASSINSDVNSITGRKHYVNSAFSLSKNSLNTGSTYIVSYWTKNTGPYTVSGTQTGWPKQGRVVTMNGVTWRYFEHQVNGVATITVSGSGAIDELRLYPANAQMSTYTYEPLVGISSACDINNKLTYYEYDAFQRLKTIRDQDGNILKTFDYQYQQ